MLRTDQTVGSSVTNARVVTVSGVTWTSFVCSHAFGYVSHGGVGSLANGQSSCEGCYAPHGSDRRFLRDECQGSHGVWGNLDLLRVFPCFRVCVTWRGGIVRNRHKKSTGSPSGRGSGRSTSA